MCVCISTYTHGQKCVCNSCFGLRCKWIHSADLVSCFILEHQNEMIKNSCTCSKKAVLGVLRENQVSGKKGCRLPCGRKERMPGRGCTETREGKSLRRQTQFVNKVQIRNSGKGDSVGNGGAATVTGHAESGQGWNSKSEHDGQQALRGTLCARKEAGVQPDFLPRCSVTQKTRMGPLNRAHHDSGWERGLWQKGWSYSGHCYHQ